MLSRKCPRKLIFTASLMALFPLLGRTVVRPKLELTYQYLPKETEILSHRYFPLERNLVTLEEKNLPCENIRCNFTSSSLLKKIDLAANTSNLIFDAQSSNVSSHPVAIQGDHSALSSNGNNAFLMTEGSENEISGFWKLTTNGQNPNSAMLSKSTREFSLGSTVRVSETKDVLLLVDSQKSTASVTIGGQTLDLTIPKENRYIEALRHGAVSTMGTYSIFDQGGERGHIYVFRNKDGKLIHQTAAPGDRTWGTSLLHFISDSEFVSIEKMKIKVYQIVNEEVREILMVNKPHSLAMTEDLHAGSVNKEKTILTYFTTANRLGVIDLSSQKELFGPIDASTHRSNPTATFPVEMRVYAKNEFYISSPKGIQFYKFTK